MAVAQRRHAGRGGVARLPVLDGFHAGLADVGEGREIRLADFEVQDLAALGFERLGTRQDGVGAFGLEGANSVCEHIRNPLWWDGREFPVHYKA